ncbi:MAG TPA: hypothetical protein VFZ40_03620 [Pyrinomonadaceae bacterium]
MMTKQQGIGTYLAQGWAANAMLTYLLLFVLALLFAEPGEWAGLLTAMPIYVSTIGTLGAAVGLFIWLAESVCGRKINILFRGTAAILLPVLLTTTIAALCGFLHDVIVLLWLTTPLIVLALPPAVLSGSRLNPLKIIVMDLGESLPKYGWTRALSIIAVPLLRFASLLGMLEALLFLACQRPDFSAWNLIEKEFVGALVAFVCFAITLTAALCLPHKLITLGIGLITNVPVAGFVLMAPLRTNSDYEILAVGGWIFVLLWGVFIVSQLLPPASRRLIPVTMCEIRVRLALNYW